MIKVSLGGVTKKYFSSRLSAIKFARKISAEKASAACNWSQTAEVISDFEITSFENGKKMGSVKLASDESFYY